MILYTDFSQKLIFAECGCIEEKSNGPNCTQTNGVCSCKPGFFGGKCEGKKTLQT